MGQTQFHNVPDQVAKLTDRLRTHAIEVKQLTAFSYQQFIESISQLNRYAEDFRGISGKKLTFEVKTGTDQSIFWRSTVRVKCCKVSGQTDMVELTKLLTLKQYLRIYDEIRRHVADSASDATVVECCRVPGASTTSALDASVIMWQIDAVFEEATKKEDEECVICMDRKATIILPCAHAYCEQCIDAWQGVHKTCPICRAVVTSGKESWVLSEKPDDDAVANEATGYVMGLIDSQPNDSDSSNVD